MYEDDYESDSEQLVLVNIIEGFVKARAKELIHELGACECDTCYLDACALALNALMPKYVTTTRGALLSEISEMQLSNKTEILVAVTRAVMQVKKHPHH
jgi:competence protein ComFB